MDLTQNLILIAAGIVILLLLRQALKRIGRRDPEFEALYRKVLLSDEHKVKGRFE